MQDMDMRDRSIRNIPLTRKDTHADMPHEHEEPRSPRKTGGRRGKWFLIIVVFVCLIGGVLLSTVFEKTTITLTAHTADVTPTAPISAVSSASAGNLVYQSFSVSRSASTTSTVSGTKKVTASASGSVTIYNTYSTAPQKLIANTRFATADGKIYRIHTAVTVPGETKSGGTTNPGTATATLYADQPGESYNLADPTRFTIPGFKGDPRYTAFYAQSSGPIAGGFVGQQAVISSADLSAASKVLKQSLQTMIESAISSGNIPTGYVVVPGTLQISYSDIAQAPQGGSSVVLSQSATARSAMIRLTDLASSVAVQMVPGYKGEPVAFKNPAVGLSGSTAAATGAVSINVSGPVTLVWQINTDDVKKALVGKPKASFESIITAFAPAVEKAEAKVRPFWEQHFPTDSNKIEVTISK